MEKFRKASIFETCRFVLMIYGLKPVVSFFKIQLFGVFVLVASLLIMNNVLVVSSFTVDIQLVHFIQSYVHQCYHFLCSLFFFQVQISINFIILIAFQVPFTSHTCFNRMSSRVGSTPAPCPMLWQAKSSWGAKPG